jgi:hypothetical protein
MTARQDGGDGSAKAGSAIARNGERCRGNGLWQMTRCSAHLAAAVALLLSGCRRSAESTAKPAERRAGCPVCSAAASIGALTREGAGECSGVVASATQPDVLYIHNDSGDAARFFAIDMRGALRGEFDVQGVTARDWEDVARGPCPPPGGSCLFFADIGDNDKERDSYTIYRVKEPAQIDQGKHAVVAEAIPLLYPDGRHNAETLLVHPVTGAITIVTKVKKGSSGIYEAGPARAPGEPVALIKAGEVAPPVGISRFTGGDVRPDGLGVLLRTYTNVFFFPMTPEQTFAQALASAPCTLPAPDEKQGESIAWVPGGWDYVTAGEGAGAQLNRVSCKAP